MTDLTGRTIVVTGARGLLGRAVCTALRYEHANVIALDSAVPDNTIFGERIWQARCDVTDEQQLRSILVRAVMVQTGNYPPDGLVCLHGVDAKPQDSIDSDPFRDWQRMIDVNLTGTMLACKVFGGAMADAGRGSIVTMASLYAIVAPDQRLYDNGFVKPAAYSASKTGVVGLTRYLAALWGERNVLVNSISLGGVETVETPLLFRDCYKDRVPLGRMATPDDLVSAVTYLLTAEYVTGHNLVVDGGFSAI